MRAIKTFRQSFRVSYDYPVIFTRNLFDPANSTFLETVGPSESRENRAMLFMDSGVEKSRPILGAQIETWFDAHKKILELARPPWIVPGGEEIKNNFSLIEKIIKEMVGHRLSRHSYIVAIGGGAMLDAVGYAASLVHRGLRLIRVPTTTLSQSDGGVGVKNAMDFGGMKNVLGTFAPPYAVLNDFEFLRALPPREWVGGIAEAFKVAIIKDGQFFKWLIRNASALKNRQREAMEQLVIRCAKLHLQHIRKSGDPFEFGTARPLDFGHWSAHKLEVMSNYRISHGQAVATGIALDSCYAALQGWITLEERGLICGALQESGLALWRDELERQNRKDEREILYGLRDFQEHLGGELCLTFPKGIGKKFEVHEMDPRLIQQAVQDLKVLQRK